MTASAAEDDLDDITAPSEIESNLVGPLVICWLFLLRGLVSYRWKPRDRFATVVRAALWAAMFASGLCRLYAINSKSKYGTVKHILASTSATFSSLGGVIVCGFQRDRKVSIVIVLNCLLVGYIHYAATCSGFVFERLTHDYAAFKSFCIILGLIAARLICMCGNWHYRGRLVSSLIPLVLATIFDASLGPRAPEYGLFVCCMFSYIVSLPLTLLLVDVKGHYYCLVASVISAACYVPFNKVFVAYAASAGQLYLWFFGPKEQRFKRMWVAVSVCVLLGLNLLSTVGSEVKDMLPLILQSMFFGSGLFACKMLTPKLAISERTRVLLASLGTFPYVTVISLGLKPDAFIMYSGGSVGNGSGFFDAITQIHFLPLASSMFVDWRLRWFLLLLTTVFLLGYSLGYEVFVDGVFGFASTLRLAALMAAVTFGLWRLSWESRFYALLACVVVGELFRAPLSALWLLLVYGVAHRYLSGRPKLLPKLIVDVDD
jgi:hypothetical protein